MNKKTIAVLNRVFASAAEKEAEEKELRRKDAVMAELCDRLRKDNEQRNRAYVAWQEAQKATGE